MPKLSLPEVASLGVRADVPQRVLLLRLSLQHLHAVRAAEQYRARSRQGFNFKWACRPLGKGMPANTAAVILAPPSPTHPQPRHHARHLFFESRPLLQAIYQGCPGGGAVVHSAAHVVLLHLVDRRCGTRGGEAGEAASAAAGCAYCTASHTAAARAKGMTDAMHGELLAVLGMAAETNRLAEALRVPIDQGL